MQKKRIIFLLTVLLILLMLLVTADNVVTENNIPISVTIGNGENRETVLGWNSDDTWYFFIPGYMNLDELSFELHTDEPVVLNGKPTYSGMTCEGLSFDVSYEVEYRLLGTEQKKQVVFVQSGGVATMFLDTESGNMAYIHGKKENEESGSARLYEKDGTRNCFLEQLIISGRGNTTWDTYDKKPYIIRLAQEENLLGMGKAQKWILLANAADHSHIRNKIVCDFAAQIGLSYSPECQWIDLYLNGEYAGLYLLSEKNEVHPERVDIAAENSVLVSGEMESRLVKQRIPYVSTAAKQVFRIHYPNEMNAIATAELTERLQSVENAILAEDDIDPLSGKKLNELIDLDSFAKKYLIDEVFGNIDGGVFSQFYYFDSSDTTGKLHAGPVWDYDLSMGSDYMWQIQNPRAFYANRPRIKEGIDSAWTYGLCQKEEFRSRVITLYQTQIIPILDELFEEKVYFYEKTIEAAASADQIRWRNSVDFHTNVNALCNYMSQRKSFLNSLWIDGDQYCCIMLIQGNNQNDAYYMVRSGENLPELPELDNTANILYEGWYYCDTNEPVDFSKPVTEDIALYAKWRENPSKKLGQIVKLLPLGMIAIVGCGLLVADIRKSQRS